MDAMNEWACIGNPVSRREGCGKRLQPIAKLKAVFAANAAKECHAAFILSQY
jgi:hypothetical protein